MGICASTETTSRTGMMEIVPAWVYTAVPPPGCERDSLSSLSDGFQSVNPYTVMRHRFGGFHTDVARWSRGFTSGKHVFEIVFPETSRGTIACIGVGTEHAPLFSKGKISIVGGDKHSWGIDLRRRRSIHKGEILKRYPSFDVALPDKIYMYLDLDSRSIMFASDFDYYGCAISSMQTGDLPVYPMVAATVQGATITMVYRGKGEVGGYPNMTVPPPGPPMGIPAHMTMLTTQPLQVPQVMAVPIVATPGMPTVSNSLPSAKKSLKGLNKLNDVASDIPLDDIPIPEGLPEGIPEGSQEGIPVPT